ncbi:hypothetical protein DFJ74DRAFT_677964 [Hyaloraphidium curvatum]|nr:hypothetical protein DFJ74DRAFT_677964 [Hyaloraphidium curvatum]
MPSTTHARALRRGTPVALLVGAALLAAAAGAAAFPTEHSLAPRQYNQNAYWYSKCLPLLLFLRSHGVPEAQLWDRPLPADSTGCCNWDASEASRIRTITCVNGVLDAIKWNSGLNGDINSNAFIDPSAQQSSALATAAWTSIDFGGNSGLSGTFPRWLKGAGNTLRAVNLSRTGISGQLPRLDILLPNLVSLDVSSTRLGGYLPPIPAKTVVCNTTPNGGMCHYNSYEAFTPPSCVAGLAECTGSAPDPSSPTIPPMNLPHWGDLPAPYSQYGMKSTTEQCDLLRVWLKSHGADDKDVWPAGNTCCESPRVKCGPWGVIKLFATSLKLKGDINTPAGTIEELRGLQAIFLNDNQLSGTFPAWIPKLPDLFDLDLGRNSLSGPFPDLTTCSQIKNVELGGNLFEGPVPVLVSRNSTFMCKCGNAMGICRLELQYGAKKPCWEHDPEFYDPVCISSNPSMQPCAWNGTVVPQPPADDVGTGFTCVKSCTDMGRYVNVKQLNSLPARLQCDGPNATACSWYLDAKCSQLAPNEEEPRQSGMVCEQYSSGWCSSAARVFANPNAVEVQCGAPGAWTCIQSCQDKGNSLRVRSIGKAAEGGTVQCQGPDATKCSWYAGPGCIKLAQGEPEPHVSGEAGMVCNQLEAGWCKIGADAVFRSNFSLPCAGSVPSGAAGAHRAGFSAVAGLVALGMALS